MSDMESAACWARDTTLGWLILLMLHDGGIARQVRRLAWGCVSFSQSGMIVVVKNQGR